MGIGADFAENIKQVKRISDADVLFWDSVSSRKDSEFQPTNLLESSIITCIDQTCYCICTLAKISACFFFLISKQTIEVTFVLILIAVKSAVTEWLDKMVSALDSESKGQNC